MRTVILIFLSCVSFSVAASQAGPRYRLVDLGSQFFPQETSNATAINDRGDALIETGNGGTNSPLYLYSDNDVELVAFGNSNATHYRFGKALLDNDGNVYFNRQADGLNAQGLRVYRPHVYRDGELTELLDFLQPGTDEWDYSFYVDAVSDNGNLIGHAESDVHTPARRTFVIENGEFRYTYLGTVRAWSGINDTGSLLVERRIGDCKTAVVVSSSQVALSDIDGVCNNEPTAINNRGNVITNAYAGPVPYDEYSAAIYADGIYELLPSLGYDNEKAIDINDSRQVLGFFGEGYNARRPFLYQEGRTRDFNDLVVNLGPFTRLERAAAINNKGVVAGQGRPAQGTLRAALAVPVNIVASIDVDPNSGANKVNPLQPGALVDVAILTTTKQAGERLDFDATQLDPRRVHLGVGQASYSGVPVIGDIDGDGDADMVLSFDVQAAGIVCFDEDVLLNGVTYNGDHFTASDTIDTSVCGGTWKTTLLPRDVDVDGTVDAYYDTVLDITWLADANYGQERYDSWGWMTWQNAQEWVAGLNTAGHLGKQGWRLPRGAATDDDGCGMSADDGSERCGYNIIDPANEMSHLFYVTLGNRGLYDSEGNRNPPGWGFLNSGPFENVVAWQSTWYWSGTQSGVDSYSLVEQAYTFNFWSGGTFAYPVDGCSYCYNDNDRHQYAWAVHDGDIGGGPVVAGEPAAIFCPGDVNADATADVAMLTDSGSVVVKGLNNSPVGRFAYGHDGSVADAVMASDFSGNGVAELITLFGESGVAESRDLLTGNVVSLVNFEPGLDYVDLEQMYDAPVAGGVELAALSTSPAVVQIRAPYFGFQNFNVGKWLEPVDLEVYPAPAPVPGLNVYRAGEVGVLSTKGGAAKSDLLTLFATPGGAVVDTKYLSKDLRVVQQELVADVNGNGYPETAVLREHRIDGSWHVALLDMSTGESLGYIGLDSAYEPQELLVISDINGNGADEIVVFATEEGGNRQKALVKDTRTRKYINAVFFDPNFVSRSVASCPDANGNGSEEIVLLGQRDNGRVRAIVKDALTDEVLGKVDF